MYRARQRSQRINLVKDEDEVRLFCCKLCPGLVLRADQRNQHRLFHRQQNVAETLPATSPQPDNEAPPRRPSEERKRQKAMDKEETNVKKLRKEDEKVKGNERVASFNQKQNRVPAEIKKCGPTKTGCENRRDQDDDNAGRTGRISSNKFFDESVIGSWARGTSG